VLDLTSEIKAFPRRTAVVASNGPMLKPRARSPHCHWSDLPAVARWLVAIRADPAFVPTCEEGPLLTEKYPHLRARLAP
jgi:hypothetical protein